jgi:CheY-like chemotaxis protein
VGEVLTSLGYSVIAVESGPAALSVLDNGTEVDVVFSDVLMPDGMSGFELAHEIRRQLPHLAIVLTSGMSGIPTAAEKAGQNLQLLRKPYKFEALSEAIEMALGAVSRGGDQRRNGDA